MLIPEGSKGKSNSANKRINRFRSINCSDISNARIKLKPLIVALACAYGVNALANPIGGAVTSGQATFNTIGNTLTVTNTPGTIINWQGFSINANEVTKFNQQSATSTVLNRVTSANPSSILGSLQSNGRVFLVNPNGIVFGAGSTVNVAGLVATTLNLSDADFLAGNHHYTPATAAQNISNAGNITALDGGQIYLIAPNVDNSGVITAPNGQILLAAGSSVDIVNSNAPSLSVNITAPAGNATNVGQLVASAGRLGLFGALVSNSGTISADSATLQGGDIVLKASQNVMLETGSSTTAASTTSTGGNINITADGGIITGGDINANGLGGGNITLTAGTGILQYGSIHANGATAGGNISARANTKIIQSSTGFISANGAQGGNIDLRTGTVAADAGLILSGILNANGTINGGNIILTGTNLELLATDIQATGDLLGGSIRIGGSFQGLDPTIAHATNTHINATTTLNASATTGNGGNVVVWSDSQTLFSGNINATGGWNATRGGMVEVSGKNLGFNGMVNASTANGLSGSLLLDPANIVIQTGGASSLSSSPAIAWALGKTGTLTELTNGNLVIANSADATIAAGAGAVWLFNGTTGALISTLTGSTVSDQVGASVTALTNGNYVVASANWNNGAATLTGAVTWGSGTTGVNGAVSAVNSLVGTVANDYVGFGGVTALSNGNYVVISSLWTNGVVTQAGAVTWANGTTGIKGTVTSTNSLVGSSASDHVGNGGAVELSNGNLVVESFSWRSGPTTGSAGAVTWMNGSTGQLADGTFGGVISATNSLVGSLALDQVGSGPTLVPKAGITALSNGNYVVNSPNWNNTGGAVTWGNGTTGTVGVVSATNSLVGKAAAGSVLGDYVGYAGITQLTNGNYVVNSYRWNNGTVLQAGAVTWVNGSNGQLADATFGGQVSAANSLVGTSTNDQVGIAGITKLTNSNYVVDSSPWNNGAIAAAGAVTWGNGATGTVGVVSATNSLVGSSASDQVGVGTVYALTNGNYVVDSYGWANGAVTGAGAVTWGNGLGGTIGAVSATNSLVGTTINDQVGFGSVTVLNNGNYVVRSVMWNNGAQTSAGAVTWGNGLGGTVGTVSQANSLVGTQLNDQVGSGGVYALSNGNYVVDSLTWHDGALLAAGAVTWGSGTTGISGVITSANSLVSGVANSSVGSGYVTVLSNGNYVVGSPLWDNGIRTDAGAATWINGSNGHVVDYATNGNTNVISAANSMLGSTTWENLGTSGRVTALSNGNYVVASPNWFNNGTVSRLGAVAWGNGSTGQLADGTFGGALTASNSLVGTTANDQIGSGFVFALSNGNYLVGSPLWDNGAVVDAGAVTLGNGATGTVGTISSANSALNIVAGSIQPLSNNKFATQLSTGWNVYNQVALGIGGGLSNPLSYASLTGQTSIIDPLAITAITNTGTAVTLQASNDITVNSAIVTVPNGGVTTGGNLNLSAGRSILVNANINLAGGTLNLLANDSVANGVVAADRQAGAAIIDTSLASLTAGAINMSNSGGNIIAGSMSSTGAINLVAGGTIAEATGATLTTTGLLTTSSVGGTTLTGSNAVANYIASNSGGGDINLNNASANLNVGGNSANMSGITNTGGGNVIIVNTGDITLPTTAAINDAGGVVTLASTGAGFINNSGSATPINATSAKIYSTAVAATYKKGMVPMASLFGCTYAGGCAAQVIPATGYSFLYAKAAPATLQAAPSTLTVTVTAETPSALNVFAKISANLLPAMAGDRPIAAPEVTSAEGAQANQEKSADGAPSNQEKIEEAGKIADSNQLLNLIANAATAKPLPVCH